MRWIRLLLIVLAFVLLVIGAGLTYLLNLDLNDYKQNIEQFVERQTGRPLVINGGIDLEIGGSTTLTLVDARFGNPDWAADEDMALVGRAYIVLNLRSVLSDATIIELVELENSQLNFEQLENGRNNWTFGEGGGDTQEATDAGPIPLILRQIHVDNFLITVRLPALEQPQVMHITRLDQVEQADGLFDAKLTGVLNDRDVEITGKYGPLESLLDAKNLTVDVAGSFGTVQVTATGFVDDLTGPQRPHAEIEIRGPDIDDVTGMLNLPDSGSGDVDLQISIQPDSEDSAAGNLAVSVSGSVGENSIDSSGALSDLKNFDHLSMRVSAHGPDLGKAARLFGQQNFPGGAYRFTGAVMRDGSRLDLNNIRLEIGPAWLRLDGSLKRFPALTDADLKLDIRGENMGRFTRLFGLPGKAKGPFRMTGELEVTPDGLEIVELDVNSVVADFTASGTIGSEPDLIGTRVSLSGRGSNIEDLTELLGISLAISEPFTFEGDIELVKDAVRFLQDTTFTIGEHRLIASGRLGYDSLNDADLDLSLSGKDLSQIAAAFGIEQDIPPVAYSASTNLQLQPAGYLIKDFNGRIDDDVISADGLISRQQNFVGTRFQVAASGNDLGKFMLDGESLQLTEGAFDLSGEVELLADKVRLNEVAIKLEDASARVNADIGLPLASANGRYDLYAKGVSLRNALPDTGPWEPPDSPFEINASGKLDDGLLQLKPLTVQLGETRISADGVFDIPPDLSRTSLQIVARTPSLARVGTLNERPLPEADFSLDAQFIGTPQSFSVQELVILTGNSNLNGKADVHLDRDIPDVNLRLRSDLLDVTPYIGKDMDAIQDNETKEPDADDDRVIPDLAFSIGWLEKFNAVTDIDIANYVQNDLRIENIVFDAKVLDGVLEVERASGRTVSGGISGTLLIKPIEDSAFVDAHFTGENILLSFASNRTAEEIEIAPKYKIDIDIDSTGLTTRELAGNLNGRVRISADAGRTANSSLRFIYGSFFGELFTTINPFAKTETHTVISCAMIVANIKNGLIDADPGLAMQTDKINIVSGGSINLRNEKLQFDFKTAPRKKISISAGEFINPYLRVTGTLAKPRLSLDPTGTLVTGGAAVATAGLSLLATAIWDRVSSSSDPCGEILKQAEQKQQSRQ